MSLLYFDLFVFSSAKTGAELWLLLASGVFVSRIDMHAGIKS